MCFFSRGKLRKTIDEKAVMAAINSAEKMTSGEIRVSVAPFFWGDVGILAGKAFKRLGMTETKDRNGILFFIVPSRRKFTVLGDSGIHAKVGQEFWDKLAIALSKNFSRGDFTAGLVEAINEAGAALAAHFPYEGELDMDELSNEVDFGDRK